MIDYPKRVDWQMCFYCNFATIFDIYSPPWMNFCDRFMIVDIKQTKYLLLLRVNTTIGFSIEKIEYYLIRDDL